MSVVFATQLTAVFTAILGVGAIVTGILAGLAFRKQAQEVGLLLEQNKRDAEERRRAQAAQVFTGTPQRTREDTGLRPYVMNASDSPVYDARLWRADSDGLPEPDDLGVIMPRENISSDRGPIYGTRDTALWDAILTFTDAAGYRWIRMPDGALTEQSRATAPESVLDALKPRLPTRYDQQDGQITGPVADSILVHPQSHGQLIMPGEYNLRSRPPDFRVDVTSADGSTQGVSVIFRPIGPEERYKYSFDVWNRRDSPVTAQIIWTDKAG
jgi:hypothetical protein